MQRSVQNKHSWNNFCLFFHVQIGPSCAIIPTVHFIDPACSSAVSGLDSVAAETFLLCLLLWLLAISFPQVVERSWRKSCLATQIYWSRKKRPLFHTIHIFPPVPYILVITHIHTPSFVGEQELRGKGTWSSDTYKENREVQSVMVEKCGDGRTVAPCNLVTGQVRSEDGMFQRNMLPIHGGQEIMLPLHLLSSLPSVLNPSPRSVFFFFLTSISPFLLALSPPILPSTSIFPQFKLIPFLSFMLGEFAQHGGVAPLTTSSSWM